MISRAQMMCPKCTCEQFDLHGIFAGHTALALIVICSECKHEVNVVTPEIEEDDAVPEPH